MAEYNDKTIKQSQGYGDTNVNVFEFGFLPLNDVFDYTAPNMFGDKNTIISTSFRKEGINTVTNFTDKKTNESS